MSFYEEEYAWRPYQITTDDGYILTAFKISKRERAPDSEAESVLFVHGYG